MRRRGGATALLLLAMACEAHAACPPPPETRASLLALQAAGWQREVPQGDRLRTPLALALLDCLADPDPLLRDELAFGALQAQLRAGRLEAATVQALRQRLLARLAAPPDAAGFAQPFAALALAEVARVDRLQPFMSELQFDDLVARGAAWLASWRDRRAFDPQHGWRHGVAHGADLMLQLSLNPRLNLVQAQALLRAIAAQVAPAGELVWQAGEAARLAAPVFYLARRPLLDALDWQRWFDGLAAQRPPERPTTLAGLAWRHDFGAFVGELYVAVHESDDPAPRARLLPALRRALNVN